MINNNINRILTTKIEKRYVPFLNKKISTEICIFLFFNSLAIVERCYYLNILTTNILNPKKLTK